MRNLHSGYPEGRTLCPGSEAHSAMWSTTRRRWVEEVSLKLERRTCIRTSGVLMWVTVTLEMPNPSRLAAGCS